MPLVALVLEEHGNKVHKQLLVDLQIALVHSTKRFKFSKSQPFSIDFSRELSNTSENSVKIPVSINCKCQMDCSGLPFLVVLLGFCRG